MTYLFDVAAKTPDPERARKNLKTFLEKNPSFESILKENIDSIALLFAYSQYLANYSMKKPEVLFQAIQDLERIEGKADLTTIIRERLSGAEYENALNIVREVKKEIMMKITLRDILRRVEIEESMEEMSDLADSIIVASLDYVRDMLAQKHGAPDNYSFAVFAMGKLGVRELNYSSDVDLIFVYSDEKGETAGIQSPSGTIINRISNHEFYCKLATGLSRFLSQNTEAGFAYRVDMRLRPDGQRGDSALSLRSYELYYESWGREWERLSLIRARYICGDETLGNEFLQMIRPFVWRKYIDFSTIDEIRSLKKRIDSAFKKDDIKRGYGGIREIEFFIQALQLIYGGKEPLLRKRKTLIALHMLRQKNLIGDEDVLLLSENYLYLRKIEHYLQMLNDLQTHVLPSDDEKKNALAKKVGFGTLKEFENDLKTRRMKIREIYNLLFQEVEVREEEYAPGIIFDEDMTDSELMEYLVSKGVSDRTGALKHIRKIKEDIEELHSLKGRRLLKKVIPEMTEAGISSIAPEKALKNLLHFLEMLSINESYLYTFAENRLLTQGLIEVFSQSDYLSKILWSNPVYLDILSGGYPRNKSLSGMKRELTEMITTAMPLNQAIRIFKKSEELRLGIMFLNKAIDVVSLIRGLTKVAEAVIVIAMNEIAKELLIPSGSCVCIAGMGKFGGREITIGSDLDILFYVSKEADDTSVKTAERFLRVMQAYTKDGIAYKIDTRLRPDGTKGPLINSISGYREYYLEHASNWEIQALLKARPVSASKEGLCDFMEMRKEVFEKRGVVVTKEEILKMRKRIMAELTKPEGGMDIKLQRGGIEEIEFLIQFLQLRSSGDEAIYYQDTMSALNYLRKIGKIDEEEEKYLVDSYIVYRKIESYLRLSTKNTIKKEDPETGFLSDFMGFSSVDELLNSLNDRMDTVAKITEELYVD